MESKEVKEAVEFLRSHFKIGIYEKKSKDIIALLKQLDRKVKQGEKYRQIVYEINNERLFDEYDSVYTIPSNIYNDIHKKIKEITLKYFPKEAK